MKNTLLMGILVLSCSAIAQPTIPPTTPGGAAIYPAVGETPVIGQCAKWISATRLGTVACGSGGSGTSITWRGAWSSVTTYAVNDAVSLSGSSYIAVTAHTNSTPPSGFWNTLASGGGGTPLITSSTPAANSDVQWASPGFVQAAIDAKTVAVVPGTHNNMTAIVDNAGVAGLRMVPRTETLVFDGNGAVIGASCTSRYNVLAGTVASVHLRSIDRVSVPPLDISGTAIVNFYTTPGTGAATYTFIGNSSITSTNVNLDTTLSGWTLPIAANTSIMACIAGTPSSVLKIVTTLVINPRFP